jgi:8-oxo-dGTP pyrophosphatase MutT (NUDIX family)
MLSKSPSNDLATPVSGTKLPQWLIDARALINQKPSPSRIDFQINDQSVGSVLPADAQWFADELPGLSFHNDVLRLNSTHQNHSSAVLNQMALLLKQANRLGQWRHEKLRVTSLDGNVLGFVERAAVRALGIKTFAVHLVLYCGDRMWVQQRALDKATDPGMWDTCVGGLVAGDESFELALEREAMEEAGVDLPTLRRAGAPLVKGQTISVNRNLATADQYEGFMREDLLLWNLNVSEQFVPTNQDGEVAQFALRSIEQLLLELATGQFTLEAVLMCAESLVLLRQLPR